MPHAHRNHPEPDWVRVARHKELKRLVYIGQGKDGEKLRIIKKDWLFLQKTIRYEHFILQNTPYTFLDSRLDVCSRYFLYLLYFRGITKITIQAETIWYQPRHLQPLWLFLRLWTVLLWIVSADNSSSPCVHKKQ